MTLIFGYLLFSDLVDVRWHVGLRALLWNLVSRRDHSWRGSLISVFFQARAIWELKHLGRARLNNCWYNMERLLYVFSSTFTSFLFLDLTLHIRYDSSGSLLPHAIENPFVCQWMFRMPVTDWTAQKETTLNYLLVCKIDCQGAITVSLIWFVVICLPENLWIKFGTWSANRPLQPQKAPICQP